MNFPHRKLSLGLALLALTTLVATAAPLRVLYFSKSAGWEHDAVKRVDGNPSLSERVLAQLGPIHDLEFTFSKDGSLFTPQYLAKFDVIMFYTSGDLLCAGVDGQPPMPPGGKQALLDAVAGGKGFVAVHSGCDTFHTGEKGGGNNPIPPSRYQNFGEASDPFIKMVGGEFLKHNQQQVATVQVIDPRFPGLAALGVAFELKEEWYSLKEFAADLHVLLVLATAGMKGPDYQRAPFPIAWARKYGRGRVWFNAMGHRDDVWESAAFQTMLVGGLEWAGGRHQAEIAPNLKTAAPDANTLPRYVPGFD
jgi:uncharacterized protein